MRQYCALLLLGILTILAGAWAFAPNPVGAKPRLRRWSAVSIRNGNDGKATASPTTSDHQAVPPRSPRSQQQQGCLVQQRKRQQRGRPIELKGPWLADLITSWFKLSRPSGASRATGEGQPKTPVRDGIRAEILELRASNARLKEEVGALRKSMIDRGYTPVEDFFASTKASPSSSSSPPPEEGSLQIPGPNGRMQPPPPPSKLPPEARLLALAVLYGAAIAVGGVFVPIAIGVGASRSLRWLDEGGTLVPERWRRRRGGPLGAGRGRGKLYGARGWKDAVLSYVPVVARVPRNENFAGGGRGSGGGV